MRPYVWCFVVLSVAAAGCDDSKSTDVSKGGLPEAGWAKSVIEDYNSGNIIYARIVKRNYDIMRTSAIPESRMNGIVDGYIFDYECKIDLRTELGSEIIRDIVLSEAVISNETFDTYWAFFFENKNNDRVYSIYSSRTYDNIDFQFFKFNSDVFKIKGNIGDVIDRKLREERHNCKFFN